MATNNDKFDYIKKYIATRQMTKDLLDKIEKKVLKKYYYCQRCENCTKFKTYKLEFEKKGLWTFNKHIRWCYACDPDFTKRNIIFELQLIRDSKFWANFLTPL